MDFSLTSEQEALRQVVREFAEQEIQPYASLWDKEHHFPIETFKKAASLGMGGLYTRADVGGSNLSRFESALIFEELSAACPATAAYISIHNMVCWIIDHYGNEQLRQKYLPELTSFNLFSSYCLTESDSGSDAANMKSTAILKDGYYLLNGSKSFISGGSVSDVYICMVKTVLPDNQTGISCLLIDKNTKGLSFGVKEQKLGWNCQPTTAVYFENCEIPQDNLIGFEHKGFQIALEALNGGRINIAACSLGGAKACLQQAKNYCHERKQFGSSLNQFEVIQFKLAEMTTNLHAAKLMTYHAASTLDQKYSLEYNNLVATKDYIMYCAMAKKYTTDIAFEIANNALQLHGGYGYLKDYNIEKYFRDLRVHQILEGTNEIMQLIIAGHVISGTELN